MASFPSFDPSSCATLRRNANASTLSIAPGISTSRLPSGAPSSTRRTHVISPCCRQSQASSLSLSIEKGSSPAVRSAIVEEVSRTSPPELLTSSSPANADVAPVAAPEELPRVSPESLAYPPGFLGATPESSQSGSGTNVAPVDRMEYLRRILTSRVYDVAVETPLELAQRLSARVGNRIFLKREDMQPVFSFKLRGAYNMMAHLSPQQLARGVICSSAGNHAQGVALAASRLGCSAVIAMPVTTPEIKWRSVQRLGAEVVLVGDSYDATQAYAKLRAEEEGRVFIPPFDHPLVIAGQGTVGMEILRQFSLPDCQGLNDPAAPSKEASHTNNGASTVAASLPPAWQTLAVPSTSVSSSTAGETAGDGSACCIDGAPHSCDLHAVFVPVGGGGLVAGIAAYLKTLKPEIKIIGVEPADANAMALSMQHGRRVQLSSCGTFADGVAVRVVGEETFRVCQELMDGVVLVSRDAICAAIKDMFEETRSILEPAGALSVAGAKAYCEYYGMKGENVVAVTSGANMNFDRLRLVAELADVGAKREAVIGTVLDEKPGSFKRFAEQLSPATNVTEFKYRYSNPERAYVLCSVGVHRPQELESMIARLEDAGMPTVDLTDNDLAKDHLRHLVGGKALVPNEALFRFMFPERPGALMKFLESLSPRWNITLFHYRRQGEMGANILVGLQVSPEDEGEFFERVTDLGYEFTDERGNKALKLFMQ